MPIPVMCHDDLLFISGISATAVLRLWCQQAPWCSSLLTWKKHTVVWKSWQRKKLELTFLNTVSVHFHSRYECPGTQDSQPCKVKERRHIFVFFEWTSPSPNWGYTNLLLLALLLQIHPVCFFVFQPTQGFPLRSGFSTGIAETTKTQTRKKGGTGLTFLRVLE